MEPDPAIKPRKGGRPLSFDRAKALKRAMLLFWERGYEATSVADLTAAMGISPPSLYAAFGDKKRLFLEAVDLYMDQGSTARMRAILESPASARAAVRAILENSIAAIAGPDTPPGCLLIHSTTNIAPAAADVQAALAAIRRAGEAAIRDRIAADVASGALPPRTDAAALARLCVTLIEGMSSRARDGATRDDLLPLVDLAMRAWPGADGRD